MKPAQSYPHTCSPFALITGGSAGIGREYAEQLAGRYGFNLFLVSNQEEALQSARQEIVNKYGVEVETLCIDLASSDAYVVMKRLPVFEKNNILKRL